MKSRADIRKTRCKILWEKIIKLGADYRCEICGRPLRPKYANGAYAHAHHIRGRVGRLLLDLKNGICLCTGCHWEAHNPDPRRVEHFRKKLLAYLGDQTWSYLEELENNTERVNLVDVEERFTKLLKDLGG